MGRITLVLIAVFCNVPLLLTQWEERDPNMDGNVLDVAFARMAYVHASKAILEPNAKGNVPTSPKFYVVIKRNSIFIYIKRSFSFFFGGEKKKKKKKKKK